MLPFNKVCEIEDFADPELSVAIREICDYKLAHFGSGYPSGVEHRKDWEVAMAVRSFERFGVLHPQSVVLGVGAGAEDTLFYLTRRVRQVFATDRYLTPGEWRSLAPPTMMLDPGSAARTSFDPNRLVVQHMDGRALRYPDETFDGIFSCGSIEHFGELQDVAYSAYEIGRVLKPGGIMALSTEFRLHGPPGGIGWPGLTLLFSRENLLRYIVEASGLELVDELQTDISEASLVAPQDNSVALEERDRNIAAQQGAAHRLPDFAFWKFPHIVLTMAGYTWCSVHLTLRKPEHYPAVPNGWAKPPASLLASITRSNLEMMEQAGRPAAPALPASEAAAFPAAADASDGPSGSDDGWGLSELEAIGGAVDALESEAWQRVAHMHVLLGKIDHDREEVDRQLASIGRLADTLGRRHGTHDIPAEPGGPDPATWVPRHILLADGTSFVVVVDAEASDHVSAALAAGEIFEPGLVSLMLDLVSPSDWVLDLGAHIGLFSLAAAAKGCHVIAVEASPTNAGLLRSAAWRSGFHNLHVVNAVASDTPGEMAFIADGPWGHVAWDPEDSGTVVIPAVTVDDLLAEFGCEKPAFVKMDIEGSEVKALRGMQTLLGRPDAPPLLYESNGHTLAKAGTSPGELRAAFEGYGCASYLVDAGRLTRLDAGDMQPNTVADCLALKQRPKGLRDITIVPRLTLEDAAARVVGESAHSNPDCRAYAAGTIAGSEPAFRKLPGVAAALDALRNDPVERVRAATHRPEPDDHPRAVADPLQDRPTDRTKAGVP